MPLPIKFLSITQKNFVVFIFFLLTLVMGLMLFKHYGNSMDEGTDRKRGIITVHYIGQVLGLEFIKRDPVLSSLKEISLEKYIEGNYGDGEHGPFFDEIAVALERAFDIGHGEDFQKIYQFRHLLNFLVFWLGSIAIYQIASRRFEDWRIGLLTATCYFLSPRFFAESFYNAMDLVFLSFFLIATNCAIAFVLKPNGKRALIAGVACAIAIDVRITGIILPLIVVTVLLTQAIRAQIIKLHALQWMLGFLLSMSITVVIFWPWLWSSPLHNFLYSFKVLSKYPVFMDVLYLGEVISVANLPWHYAPVWIAITTPLLYLFFFLVGFAVSAARAIESRLFAWRNPAELQDLIFLGIFTCPLLAIIAFHSVLYDGWRHLYFIYPAFLLIATHGFVTIAGQLQRSLWLSRFFFTFSALGLVSICLWMIQSHPYQNMFFNLIERMSAKSQFEADYWGLSNKQALEYIVKSDPRPSIQVYPGGLLNIDIAAQALPPADRKRIKVTDSLTDFDYLLTNYRTDFADSIHHYPAQLEHQITVDDRAIAGVYKRKTFFIPTGNDSNRGQGIHFYPAPLQANEHDSDYLWGLGWGSYEKWGVWSTEPRASLFIPKRLLQNKSILQIECIPFTHASQSSQEVSISINGGAPIKKIFSSSAKQILEIPLAKVGAYGNGDRVQIQFQFGDLKSPKELGISVDERLLGIGISGIELR